MSDTSKGPAIRNVSDTARWVAFYRAMETERKDAIFHDPYARKLAGARGEEIVNTLRGGKRQAWAMIVRTALLDDMLLRTIAGQGIDLVVNLAAGLDTRPYRLALPAALQWVEVDLPEMIAYKTEMLGSETPHCQVERMAVDLADDAARRELFGRLDAGARRALVITEGLLAYLSEEHVGKLAHDLHERQHFQYWLTDIASPKVKQMMEKHWGKELRAAGAPIHFAPEVGEEFFRPFGWESIEFRGFFQASREFNRPVPGDWMIRLWAKLMPRRTAKMMKLWRSGATLLRRV
ncbi:MAG TPA: class I SAM-dependent methyltransferase [Candidatus Acidoferrales bacterium]|nr:class I SAM-dependent methyltransferase [Candidatus Acidoferrales bacterium]